MTDESRAKAVQQTPLDWAASATDLRRSGVIKWFDATRGFGFLTASDESEDILIHFTTLAPFQRRSLPEGARVECLAIRGERGLQAKEILKIDLTNAVEHTTAAIGDRSDPAALLNKAGAFENVTLKWFNTQKGYGFLVRPGDDADIFLHTLVLRNAGLDEPLPGSTLRARIALGRRGLVAAEVSGMEPEQETARTHVAPMGHALAG